MYRIFLFLCLWPIFLAAESDEFFSENEDTAIFQHVNVITGNLNFSFQDALILGSKPIPIIRTYSSSGALERTRSQVDLILKAMRKGWVVQGGWTLFPHESMLIETSPDRMQFKVHLIEPNGSLVSYVYSHEKKSEKHTVFFKSAYEGSQTAGKLSFRTNPENHSLQIDLKKGIAILHLPNGGIRTYAGRSLHEFSEEDLGKCFYLLKEERLPSGHLLCYSHNKETKELEKIESKNHRGTKVYAAINIQSTPPQKNHPLHLTLHGSDGKKIEYSSILFEQREYLSKIEKNFAASEQILFEPGRKGSGARMSSLELGGKKPFRIQYYFPTTAESERKWAHKPEQKEFQIDKIAKVFAPVGPEGKEVLMAQFEYSPNSTDVRDSDGLLIRYHHDSKRLTLIEYFDEQNELCSSQRFYWKGTQLQCKAVFNEKRDPLFAKTFTYEKGNVVAETVWGYLTGNLAEKLLI